MRFRWRRPTRLPLATAREAWARFGDTLADQRGALAATVGFSILLAALELARPWPLKYVVDQVLGGASGIGSGFSVETRLALAAAAILAISLLIGQIGVWSSVLSAQIGRKVTTRARRRVGEHLHRLAIPFHHGSTTGDLVVRVMGDIDTVRDLLFAGWTAMASRVLLFIGVTALLAWASPVLALIALAPLPLLAIGVAVTSSRMREVTKKQRQKVADATSFAVEAFDRVHVVKAFGAEGQTARAFAGLVRSGERAGVRAARLAASSARSIEFLTGIGVAAVLWAGTRQVMAGTLTLGQLTLVISYARMLYKPIRKFGRDGVRLAKAGACAERLFEVLRLRPEDESEGATIRRIAGPLRLEKVVCEYGDGRRGLDGLDVEFPAGSLSLLCGENGAGKSTTFAVLLRLLEPSQGRLTVEGRDAREISLASWRERIAYLPQDDLLFRGSVRDNLLFGRPEASEEELREALRDACADSFVDELPQGLDTELGEGAEALSRGQRRRLALARAALRPGEVFLLDEPLEGLDPATRREVAEAIRRIARGRTTIVISHGDAAELEPDRVVTLAAGRLVSVEVATAAGESR